jgi:hypothetical protein
MCMFHKIILIINKPLLSKTRTTMTKQEKCSISAAKWQRSAILLENIKVFSLMYSNVLRATTFRSDNGSNVNRAINLRSVNSSN